MTSTTQLCALACRLAARQHHLVTRDQLLRAGITRSQIEVWQTTGFLARVERSVFLVPSGRLDWTTWLHAVTLSSGGVASHRSAAALHGLEGCNAGRPEISIPHGAKFRRARVRVHESTDLHLVQPVWRDGIPTTPVARTLLDLGAVAPNVVDDAATDAVARRLTSWPDLFTTLIAHSRKGRRGCAPLRAVLDLHYGDGTESAAERRFRRLIRDSGLPRPVEQHRIFDDVGFIMRADFAYPDHLIAIEVDSVEHHLTREAFEADRVKRNRLRIAGWLLLEITDRRMRRRPTAVIEELAAALRVRATAT
jgi:very-short-patch-repair endonuclease